MINKHDHPVEWALLLSGLDDAREHIEELIDRMNSVGAIDDAEFAVYIGHVYAHLNRVWHSRCLTGEVSDDQWAVLSRFPDDLEPVG